MCTLMKCIPSTLGLFRDKSGLQKKFCVFAFLSSGDAERDIVAVSLGNKLLCFEEKPLSFLRMQGLRKFVGII